MMGDLVVLEIKSSLNLRNTWAGCLACSLCTLSSLHAKNPLLTQSPDNCDGPTQIRILDYGTIKGEGIDTDKEIAIKKAMEDLNEFIADGECEELLSESAELDDFNLDGRRICEQNLPRRHKYCTHETRHSAPVLYRNIQVQCEEETEEGLVPCTARADCEIQVMCFYNRNRNPAYPNNNPTAWKQPNIYLGPLKLFSWILSR